MTICRTACLALLAAQTSARASVPATAVDAARAYGFTGTEIERVLQGDVLTKELKEGSDKELAGVVAVWLPVPVVEFADIALEGKLLKLDSSIRSLNVWKPDDPADKAFTDLYVDVAQQAIMKERYQAYRKKGLAGVGSPGE